MDLWRVENLALHSLMGCCLVVKTVKWIHSGSLKVGLMVLSINWDLQKAQRSHWAQNLGRTDTRAILHKQQANIKPHTECRIAN